MSQCTSELLPCPFCGGEAHLYPLGDIRCHKCGLIMPFGWAQIIPTEAEAIEAWNTRHDERVDFLEEVEAWAFCNMECCDGDEWELFTSIYGAIAKYRRAAYGG